MFEKIEKFVSCVCVFVMAILVFANVVSRFAFKHSMAVSDEMSTYLFVLMSFMGTAIAARRKAHLGLSIVTDLVHRLSFAAPNTRASFFSSPTDTANTALMFSFSTATNFTVLCISR